MTNNTKTGGPAFPLNDALCMNGNPLPSRMGMTLRDYFAAKAMQGYLASYPDGAHPEPVWVSTYSYQMADAMMKAREA